MLQTLMIRNLALIEALDLEFAAGLNIVTGETGTGKSILIGALQLILGQRAEKSIIRAGAAACEISAVLSLEQWPRGLAEVEELLATGGAAACDHGQLLVRRVVTEKASRHFVNSCPVTLDLLKRLGDVLIDVHGPYDHQSLLLPARQLEVLDAFAGLRQERAAMLAAYRRWQDAEARLTAAAAEQPTPDAIEVLRHQLTEITAAELQPAEDEDLVRRHGLAANSRQILELLARCRAHLEGEDAGLLSQTAVLMRDLYALEAVDAATARAAISQLENVTHELQGLTDELAASADRVESDPRELARLEDRLALVHRLKRKYGGTLAAVIAFADGARQKLARLEDFGSYLETLRRERDEQHTGVREQARLLSQRRHEAAAKLARQVSRKLRRLGFPQAELTIALAEAALGPTGGDHAEFHFAPNPGEGAKPLREIASSGEIARVMLALKTVLAEADETPILVFDEVDANIGGVVANEVAGELRALGQTRQVLCITHLPQIAAGATRHFRVAKVTRRGRTLTQVEALADDERVAEIARMLGGADSSSVALKHAAELVARAERPG